MISKKQELVIDSNLQDLNKVVHMVEEISDAYNINNTYFGNILVSLTEAVRNAIIHGNREDHVKKVHILFSSSNTALSFSVRDEGEGFDPARIPDPTEAEEGEGAGIKKGLYLIRSLSDELYFKDGGRLLEIVFHISSINYELSMHRTKALRNYFQSQEQKVSREK